MDLGQETLHSILMVFFSYQGHECIYVNMNFMFSYILPTEAILALHIH